MNVFSRSLILSSATIAFVGCSYLPTIPYLNEGSSTPSAESTTTTLEQTAEASENPQPPTSRVAVEPLTALASSDVEILWEVPEDSVDGFVVRYGTDREQLANELKLASNELELRSDPQRGQVYRHVIRNVPSDKAVFVNIAAYRGAEVSPPSRLFEVPAAESTAMAQPNVNR